MSSRRFATLRLARAVGALRAAGGALALASAGLTCDASSALRSPGLRDVALAWAADTVFVAGATATARVDATVDGEPYAFPRLVIASSDTGVVLVRADGVTLEARRLGTATLTVRLLSAAVPGAAVTLERPVRVVPKSLVLAGAADTLRSFGDTASVRATAVDAHDRPIADLGAAWASSDTSVAVVSAAGVVTARRDGEALVRATVAGLTAEAPVRVRQRAARLALGPAIVLDALGADAPLAAEPVDARGHPVVRLAGLVAWESSAPGVAAFAAGRVTAVDNGAAFLRASADGVRDSVRVDVAQRAARVVVETPGPLALRSVGEAAVLVARGYDRRDNEVRLALPVWRSQNPPVAHVEPRTGILTAIATGDAVLVAEQDGATATLAVSVADVPDRVVADPQGALLESVGDTLRVRWSVRNARGVEIVGAPVAVGSSDSAVALALPDGRVVALGVGVSRVVVGAGAVADTVVVTVINAVAHVDIVPQVVTLASVGDTVVPAVVLRTARGQALAAPSAAWRSTNEGVARVVAGTVVARGAGEAVVYAESPTAADRRDSVLVVVTDAPASLRLTADRDSLTAVGQTRRYEADVRNARGAVLPDAPIVWSSTDPTVATVSAAGVVTATGAGAAGVVARAGGAADTVALVVRNAPAALELVPGAASLTSVGDTVRLAVAVRNALGAPVAGVAAAWRSLDTLVATSVGDGNVLAVGTGTARVVATVEGLADTAVVTVANALALVDLAPDLLVMASVGDSVAPPAVLANARGAALPRGAAAWSSDDPLVARATSAGVVVATGVGETYVRAAGAGGARDSVQVQVTNAPASVVVDAAADTLVAVGQTRARAAEVRNARGALLAAPALWHSADPSVASVSGAGVVTAVAVGTARVIASAGAAADTLYVVVRDVPVSLEVVPGTASVTAVGDTARLGVVARNALGAVVAGATAAWRSLDTLVARPAEGGAVVAVGTGTARVVASIDALADTAVVLVANVVASVDIVPEAVVLASVADSLEPAAFLANARGAPLPRGAALWSSDDPLVARVTSGGLVIATGAGETVVRASGAGAARDSLLVAVTNAPAGVAIDAAVDTFTAVGRTRVRAAEVRNARGALLATPVAWRSADPSVATVSASGVVTAVAVGSARVIAAAGAAADTLFVAVRDVPVTLDVSPAAASVTSVGDTVRLAATARNELGAVVAGAAPAWRSLDTLVARSLGDGAVEATGAGSARVVASVGALADTAVVSVVNAVASVDLAGEQVVLASVADSAVPAVAVANARGAALPRTAVSWSIDDPLVARVTAAGIVIATGAGETLVRAAGGTAGARDSLLVVVTNAPASVAVDAAADTLRAVGQTRAHAAEVRNARGALLATPAAWRSADPSVASVSGAGVVTAVAVGTARVIASAGVAADTVVVTVLDVPTTLDVSPSALAVRSLGDTARATATARNELGAVVAGAEPEWHSSDTTVARALPGGFVVAVGVGAARVVARLGGLADTAAVTVTNEPAEIDLARTTDTLTALGDSLAPALTVRNARGDPLPRTAVTWSVDDPVVARVSLAGMVTARDTGATWVRAAGGGARDSLWLVVQNLPASVQVVAAPGGAPAERDTLTAVGQELGYGAVVRNRVGVVIAGAPVSWRSTDASVAAVSAAGAAAATGLGSALVIARAGDVEDSVAVVVVDPQRLYVDNGVAAAVRVGTIARPYASIQAAVDAAGVGDTVVVRRGVGYSEAVTLGRRVTLLGDSAAFVAGGRDPLLLPQLRHDLGAAGVSASTPGASYTVRYLAVQHSVDGEAVVIRDAANALLEYVFVNPAPGFKTGRGILIENAAGAVTIARSGVDSVFGFGVRVQNADGARVEAVTVAGVGARAGYSGAGVELSGGAGGVVTGASVRRTAGPQVLLAGTTGASLLASTLAGEQQLVRLTGVLGATTVAGNTLDMRPLAGDPPPVRGGSAPDPSGLEASGVAGLLLENNVFRAEDGLTSLMDGVRLADVRASAGGGAYGATLARNRFGGGRTAVRSERSTWRMTGSRVDSAGTAVLLGAADTVALESDTLANARLVAVSSAGAAASLALTGGVVSGPRRAVVVTGAARAVIRGTSVAGAAGGPALDPSIGAVDLSAGVVEVVGASVTGVQSFAGVVLRGGAGRLDSSLVARNAVGVRVPAAGALLRGNAFLDNDVRADDASPRGGVALVNATGLPMTVGANWWGDARGPALAGRLSPTYGDSILGTVTYDSLASPILALRGAGPAGAVRQVDGDAQVVPVGATSAPLVVRVVDAAGRPLAGRSVTFDAGHRDYSIVECGAQSCVVVSDAGGFASARWTASRDRGAVAATATADGRSAAFTIGPP